MTIDDALREAATVCRISAQSLTNLNHPDLAQDRMLTAATLVDHRLNRSRDLLVSAQENVRLRKLLKQAQATICFCLVMMGAIILAAIFAVEYIANH
jgi:hypothetical protein